MMSNSTLLSADRATHLKIVAISLIAGFLVIGVGVAARQPSGVLFQDNATVQKAGKPVSLTSHETTTIR
jgi:hypothetical protein